MCLKLAGKYVEPFEIGISAINHLVASENKISQLVNNLTDIHLSLERLRAEKGWRGLRC